jgi:hypothetical protein
MAGFLAYIMPVSGGPVDPGFGVPGWPSHPIAPGGPPPVVSPPIYYPPGIWPSPGHPAHPIAPGGPPPWVSHPIPPSVWPQPPGGQPPGIWGGPGSLPPWVMPPIAPGGPGGPPLGTWGGDSPWPGYARPPIAPGGQPPGIWGPTDPRPTHPIVIPIPPGEQPPEPGNGLTPSHPIYIPGESGPGGVKQLVFVYIPGIGGVWFMIDVPPAAPPHPAHPIVEPPPSGGPKA